MIRDSATRPSARALPTLALVFNALTWGLSWWPLRHLEALGLHPLWATALVFGVASLGIGLVQPKAWQQLAGSPALWLVMLAAGSTNAAFNWAVTEGDVVRVVLLFYLMPLWAALLACWILKEPLTLLALVRVALALGGAAVVLWPHGAGGVGALPLPSSLPDVLGLAGGFCFALNNVLLRKEAERSGTSRALAMFVGGVVVAGATAAVLTASAKMAPIPAVAWPWLVGVLGLSLVFLCSNFALQYGAARLPANVAAIIMLSEVLFATLSAVWLGAAELRPQVFWGGALIMLAAALSLLPERSQINSQGVLK